MSRALNRCLATLTLLAAATAVTFAQAVPASTMSPSVGPGLPSVDGIFHYSLSGSELFETGYQASGLAHSTILSGSASYNSRSVVHPFGMVYSGGLLFGNQYGSTVTTFQNFVVSQGLVKGVWSFGVADSVSYLPQSPTTGLSGLAGLGDIGSEPISGPSSGPAGGILTNNATNVSNALSGNVERRLSDRTSVNGVAAWSILRFPGGEGLDSQQIMGEGGLNHRLDVRDTVSGNVSYSTMSYGSGIDLSIQTLGVNGAFQRVLSRDLSMNVSAGPLWIRSSNSALVPSNLTYAADLGLTYTHRYIAGSLSYTRGVEGGSGVQAGILQDTVAASIGRTYGRDWMTSLTANYSHSSGLVQNGATLISNANFLYAGGKTSTIFGGAQVSRRLTDSLSAYASYNLQHQSIDNSLALQNAFSGLSQTFGVGITFSPRSTHLGQF
jgi:hypothetical protein